MEKKCCHFRRHYGSSKVYIYIYFLSSFSLSFLSLFLTPPPPSLSLSRTLEMFCLSFSMKRLRGTSWQYYDIVCDPDSEGDIAPEVLL